jgi:hypothetical protein
MWPFLRSVYIKRRSVQYTTTTHPLYCIVCAVQYTHVCSMAAALQVFVAVVLMASALVSAEIGKKECTDVNYDCNRFPGSRKCGDSCRDKARAEGSSNYASACEPAVAPFKCCCTVKDPHHPWPPSSSSTSSKTNP